MGAQTKLALSILESVRSERLAHRGDRVCDGARRVLGPFASEDACAHEPEGVHGLVGPAAEGRVEQGGQEGGPLLVGDRLEHVAEEVVEVPS